MFLQSPETFDDRGFLAGQFDAISVEEDGFRGSFRIRRNPEEVHGQDPLEFRRGLSARPLRVTR